MQAQGVIHLALQAPSEILLKAKLNKIVKPALQVSIVQEIVWAHLQAYVIQDTIVLSKVLFQSKFPQIQVITL